MTSSPLMGEVAASESSRTEWVDAPAWRNCLLRQSFESGGTTHSVIALARADSSPIEGEQGQARNNRRDPL
jgi:hypothetical protein